jgi:hypothetical protein
VSLRGWKEKKVHMESEIYREENLQGYFVADVIVSEIKNRKTYLQ